MWATKRLGVDATTARMCQGAGQAAGRAGHGPSWLHFGRWRGHLPIWLLCHRKLPCSSKARAAPSLSGRLPYTAQGTGNHAWPSQDGLGSHPCSNQKHRNSRICHSTHVGQQSPSVPEPGCTPHLRSQARGVWEASAACSGWAVLSRLLTHGKAELPELRGGCHPLAGAVHGRCWACPGGVLASCIAITAGTHPCQHLSLPEARHGSSSSPPRFQSLQGQNPQTCARLLC